MHIVEVLEDSLLAACVPVIRAAFQTVADDLGFTQANAPTNAAFITLEQLRKARAGGVRMFALLDDQGEGVQPAGFVALERSRTPGLSFVERLAVHPAHRHHGHGRALMDHAFAEARRAGAERISIGVIDENAVLKRWYQAYGFAVTSTKRFEHLPFTVCFMEKPVAAT